MPKIAILPSTKPLRIKESVDRATRERLNPAACGDLAKNYDMVIIGSTASDELFRQIVESIPKASREHFKLYSRSYFRKSKGASLKGKGQDVRDDAWKEILKENAIEFQESRKVVDENFRTVTREFTWKDLKEFITDERVEVVT